MHIQDTRQAFTLTGIRLAGHAIVAELSVYGITANTRAEVTDRKAIDTILATARDIYRGNQDIPPRVWGFGRLTYSISLGLAFIAWNDTRRVRPD